MITGLIVLGAGVEPALVSQHAPQACASANSATRAALKREYFEREDLQVYFKRKNEKRKKSYFAQKASCFLKDSDYNRRHILLTVFETVQNYYYSI